LFSLREYIAAESTEQAYRILMEDKDNVILGGLLWIKMSDRQYRTGIDLNHLGLDQITETPGTIEIGCMTSLRQMETNPLLSRWFGSIFSKAFNPIVGIQFRNLATVGGSVYLRPGFSDVITALLSLGTRVTLYKAGSLTLAEFIDRPHERDLLLNIQINKQQSDTSYQSFRMTATDFPVLSLAVCRCDGKFKISVGARPGRACLAPETAALLPASPTPNQIAAAAKRISEELSFGTDRRGSASYRKTLALVLLKRGVEEICSSSAT
jgi:putative selenate reductase FAD-binding subunit